MKKDIEWLKEGITEILLTSKKDGTNYFYYRDLKEKIYNAINQLDEPEVLSQEWISENMYYVEDRDSSMVHVGDLQNLLVPKQEVTEEQAWEFIADNYNQDGAYWWDVKNHYESLIDKVVIEKPTIPQFVADIIEAYKSNSSLTNLFEDLVFHGRLAKFVEHEDKDEVFEWARSNRIATDEILARAWLDGYEVEEEEPLYRARLKVITDEFIASYLCTQSSDAEDRLKTLEIGSKYIHEDYRHLSEFTEDELKILDIWDSEQWEVEELEE